MRSTLAKQRPEENQKERELKHLRGEVKRLNSLLAKETERRHKAEENMKQFQTTAEEATQNHHHHHDQGCAHVTLERSCKSHPKRYTHSV